MSSKLLLEINKSIGKEFGNLTLLSFLRWKEYAYKGRVHYLPIVSVVCKCGVNKDIYYSNIKRGSSTSCGCERDKKSSDRLKTHGYAATKIYRAWTNMMKRCYNDSDNAYKNYGGRGIKVCRRWHIFELFLQDMGQPPTKHHTLERVENNKGYNKDNCKWVTRKSQQRNLRSNRVLEYNNEKLCVSEWSERLNVKSATIYARVNRGWTIGDALMTQVK